jgi:hypothetical protein
MTRGTCTALGVTVVAVGVAVVARGLNAGGPR